MFHCYYTCDVCHRVLDPGEDVRYSLRITPSSDADDSDAKIDDDRDYLEEINDRLECTGSFDDMQLGDDVEEAAQYDLCSECRQRFSLESPPARVMPSLDFSEN